MPHSTKKSATSKSPVDTSLSICPFGDSMTGQASNVAAQNLKMLCELFEKADENGSVVITWFDTHASDADLPYDQAGKESGVVSLLYQDKFEGVDSTVLAYDTIVNGNPDQSYVTIFNKLGEEVAVYEMPPMKAAYRAPNLLTSRLSEFLVWSDANASDFPESLQAARDRLLQAYKHKSRAESGRIFDRVAQDLLNGIARR